MTRFSKRGSSLVGFPRRSDHHNFYFSSQSQLKTQIKVMCYVNKVLISTTPTTRGLSRGATAASLARRPARPQVKFFFRQWRHACDRERVGERERAFEALSSTTVQRVRRGRRPLWKMSNLIWAPNNGPSSDCPTVRPSSVRQRRLHRTYGG